MELNSASTEVERVRLGALYNEALKDAELLELQLALMEKKALARKRNSSGGPAGHE